MRQVFFAILLFCTIPCLAQKAQELQNSYNYKRGLELFSADTPDYSEAADDVIKAIDLNGNQYAYTLLSKFKSVGRDILIAKLRIQQAKDKNNNLWSYLQGCVYEDGGDYNAAIKAFEAAYELGAEDEIKDRLAACHRNLGDYNKALDCIQQAILMDSTDMGHLLEQARSLYELGRTEEALEAIGKYIDKAPDNAIGYYFKAGFEEAQGKAEEAITDLTTAIVLAPDFAQIYLVRGNIYKRQGKTSEAMADYRKVVEIDTVFTDDDCAKYAYYELGDKAKAMAIQDSTLANSQSKNEYYDAACLYSRMGEYDKAMEYLQTALEKGFCEFTHIKDDHDLDPLRGRDDFKTLIGKYKRNVESSTTEKFTPPVIEADALVMPGREGGQAEEAGKGQLVSEIPFTRVQGGLCKVKCNINGLPLSFWLDTGASDVSMSIVEATFMMKNGYLSKDDVVGSSYYLDANGDVSEGTKLILRKVTFGDDVLTNVHASVIRNQKAPLLLGQSVLARLGKVEIDNQKCVIKISR